MMPSVSWLTVASPFSSPLALYRATRCDWPVSTTPELRADQSVRYRSLAALEPPPPPQPIMSRANRANRSRGRDLGMAWVLRLDAWGGGNFLIIGDGRWGDG